MARARFKSWRTLAVNKRKGITMNAKKTKTLRQLVRTCVNVHHIAKVAQDKAEYLNATPKQISRAFDVVLGTRNFRNRSPYMQ